MKLFLAPHNDDEVLWGAFTILREKPTVLILFDSYVQPSRGIVGCEPQVRRAETCAALQTLGVDPPMFAGLRDDREYIVEYVAQIISLEGFAAEHVWAPALEADGHPQHNVLARAADMVFPGKVTHYLSYTNAGKSRGGKEVTPEAGKHIARKLKALACYESQLEMDPRLACWPHFVNDLREYVL
jgi:LmbE family N-acetylglucosaminyl deacetylase